MDYEKISPHFPELVHVDQVHAAIETLPASFKSKKWDDHLIFNYIFGDSQTFPSFEDEKIKSLPVEEFEKIRVRFEIRGIIFCADTGRVLSRRFHKFFNIGERPDTAPEKIDLSKPHVILEKLDGSVVAPFYTRGRVAFGTKMGVTEVGKPVEEFVEKSKTPYVEFSRHWLDRGFTPIYEWCSNLCKIVIDYETDELTVTAIRHNRTGNYVVYDEMVESCNAWGVPVVQKLNVGEYSDINGLLDNVRRLSGVEGIVIRFDDGTMYKVKSDWYRELHYTKSSVHTEADFWKMILDNQIDDLKVTLNDKHRKQVDDFQELLISNLRESAAEYVTEFSDYLKALPSDEERANLQKNRKEYVKWVTSKDLYSRPFFYKLLDWWAAQCEEALKRGANDNQAAYVDVNNHKVFNEAVDEAAEHVRAFVVKSIGNTKSAPTARKLAKGISFDIRKIPNLS